MNEKIKFAFSATAQDKMGNWSHTCAVVEAVSKYEAQGYALAIARKLYPFKEGFIQHNVVVSPITNVVTLETVSLLD